MRLLLNDGEQLRRLLNITISDRDGSISLVFPRRGTGPLTSFDLAAHSTEGSPGGEVVARVEHGENPKDVRLTIHTSGRINFGHYPSPPIFIEPLWALTDGLQLVTVRVPALDKLDAFEKTPNAEDAVLATTSLGTGPTSFAVHVGAHESAPPPGSIVTIAVPAGPAISVLSIAVPEEAIPHDLRDRFTVFVAGTGTRSVQQVPEDVAMIGYFRTLLGDNFSFPIGPDGAGVYRVIFPVQMREPPLATIRPSDPALFAEVLDQTTDQRSNRVQVKFRVRERATNKIVKSPVEFADMEFDAELRIYAP